MSGVSAARAWLVLLAAAAGFVSLATAALGTTGVALAVSAVSGVAAVALVRVAAYRRVRPGWLLVGLLPAATAVATTLALGGA